MFEDLYEGVDYIVNKKTNKVYNEEFLEVGTCKWKVNKIKEIDWSQEKFRKQHNKRKKESKEESDDVSDESDIESDIESEEKPKKKTKEKT